MVAGGIRNGAVVQMYRSSMMCASATVGPADPHGWNLISFGLFNLDLSLHSCHVNMIASSPGSRRLKTLPPKTQSKRLKQPRVLN